jgi:hypothetical protein
MRGVGLCVFRHLGGLLSCRSTRRRRLTQRRWVPWAPVSFEKALGFPCLRVIRHVGVVFPIPCHRRTQRRCVLRLRVVRHSGVWLPSPPCPSTQRRWVYLTLAGSARRGPNPSDGMACRCRCSSFPTLPDTLSSPSLAGRPALAVVGLPPASPFACSCDAFRIDGRWMGVAWSTRFATSFLGWRSAAVRGKVRK